MDPGRLFDLDRHLTTTEAAQAVNVSPHAVRKWRTRGYLDAQGQRHWLEAVDTDGSGNPRHRYRDVLAAEQATNGTGRPRSSGGPQQIDSLSGTLRPVDWDVLDRQHA